MPMWTRPTSPAATPARSSAALIAVAPSFVAGTDCREPRKLPMAVRAAPTSTTSRMTRAYRAVTETVKARSRRAKSLPGHGFVRRGASFARRLITLSRAPRPLDDRREYPQDLVDLVGGRR